jgi:hypothetical protein
MRTVVKLVCALVVVPMLLAAPVARAATKTHEEAGVSVWIPDDWKGKGDKNMMTIMDPKEDVALLFLVMNAPDLKKATDALDAELAKRVQDVKFEGKAQQTKLNGMDALTLDGTGKVQGKLVDLGVLVVKTPKNKIVLVLGMVNAEKKIEFKPTVRKIITSLKPA